MRFRQEILMLAEGGVRTWPNPTLEPTAAPLRRSTVAVVRTRAVRSILPAGGCGSAWVP